MTGFVLHPEAYSDVDETWEYIAVDSLNAADRGPRARKKSTKPSVSLATSPHQGHNRRDLTSRPRRFQSVRNYVIAYAPDETPFVVIAVLHGRRSPRVIAAILRGRD